jgi:hypothetical protein
MFACYLLVESGIAADPVAVNLCAGYDPRRVPLLGICCVRLRMDVAQRLVLLRQGYQYSARSICWRRQEPDSAVRSHWNQARRCVGCVLDKLRLPSRPLCGCGPQHRGNCCCMFGVDLRVSARRRAANAHLHAQGIRGTFHLKDALTDLVAHSTPIFVCCTTGNPPPPRLCVNYEPVALGCTERSAVPHGTRWNTEMCQTQNQAPSSNLDGGYQSMLRTCAVHAV